MEGLASRIKGDLFDIRERWDSRFDLDEYFSLTPQRLLRIASGLRLAVEEGAIEFKRSRVLSVFSFLESLKYDSRGFDKIPSHCDEMTMALYVCLLQRQIAMGTLRLAKPRQQEPQEEQEVDAGIKQILRDVQSLIKEDQTLRTNLSVKNILMQMQIYRKELANMQSLLPNILPEKKQAFYANFRNVFQRITEKIQGHYQDLLKELKREEPVEFAPDKLSSYDLKPGVSFYVKQIELLSELRSVLLFAQSERYKTRELLLDMVLRREEYITSFSRELGMYVLYEKGSTEGRLISRLFAQEIATLLERSASSGDPSPSNP